MNTLTTIQDYLCYTKVIDIFYCRDKTILEHRLYEYLDYGTKSLARKYITQKKIPLCEYRLVKVLTFFDVIRDNANQSKHFGEFLFMLRNLKSEFKLVDYLLEYITAECTLECVEYSRIDFFTHYAKRHLLKYRIKQVDQTQKMFWITLNEDTMFNDEKTLVQRVLDRKKLVQKSSFVYSMMLLDFNRVYKVIALRKFGSLYIITLFTFIIEYMVSDFWLPSSCLDEIKGSKYVHPNGNMEIYQNQYIRVVNVEKYKGKNRVVIQSYTTKSITQLKKRIINE